MRVRWTSGALALAATVSATVSARADEDRLDADLGLSLEAGGGHIETAAAIVQARALYLATAGVYASFIAHPRGETSVIDAGVELRPLFVPRFTKNLEGERATWEIALDSLALSVGTHAPIHGRPGLSLGTGLELPLQASFRGFYLAARGGLLLSAETFDTTRPSVGFFFFTIGYRGLWAAHLVDAGDTVMR